MIKKLAKLLLGLILLSIVAGVILLMSVNTDQNKAAIQAAVLSSTGYELTIAGDMDISFFPSVGLTLNDVRLKNPRSPQELASTTAALLQVDLRALIGGEIFIRELSTEDFHINYYIDADGKSNWDIETPSLNNNSRPATSDPQSIQQSIQQQSNPAPSDTNSKIVRVSFERLKIDNASIDIQDLSQGLRYSVSNLNLTSSNTNIEGNPFDVDVNFTFLNNGMTKPIAMGFRSNVTADISAGNIDVQNISFNVTPLLLQGELHISGLNDSVTFDGSLSSNDFDVFGLLQTIGIRDSELDATSSLFSIAENPQASVEARFSGDEFGIVITELIARLSESRIEAVAEIRFSTDLSPANISYEIAGNQIDISPFLDSETTTDTTAIASNRVIVIEPNDAVTAPPAPVLSTAIPSQLLNSFNVLGSIAIESVVANDRLFTGINVFTNVEDGVLDIELQPVATFEGSVAGNIRIDGRNEVAALSTQLVISQLNLVDLAPSVSRLNSVTGNLDVDVDLTAAGQTTSEIMDSLNGSITFAVTNNSVDIGVIKQVFTAISALSPSGGAIEQWPDVIRFAELGGFILLNNGLSENQQLNLRMDNFDISGTGGIDLQQENFNYDLQFTILGEPYLQTIQVDDLYHDVAWPVVCAAAFEDEVNQYCRPDFTQVRGIFTQLGTNAVIDRLDEVISDQLPPEVRDGVRGLLRNLFN
ncbi:MAG: AsmA family protein [Gammaproteobacteria bacterium]|nr:AsmA family protein [Gammaproteobacteria bacterium]